MLSSHSLERGYVDWDQKLINSLTQLRNLWATVTTDVARFAHGDNSGTDAMGLTKHILLEFKTCSKEENAYLVTVNLSKNPYLRSS